MGYGVCVQSCEDEAYEALESRLAAFASAAHKQVLFEKIKQRIEREEGDKLDKIAELLVETSKLEWQDQQTREKKREELRQKLKETFEDGA